MPSFDNLRSAAGLQKLNEYLESRSYITGYSATADDARTFALVTNNVNRADFPHVARWASHISALIAAHKLQPVFVEEKEDAVQEEQKEEQKEEQQEEAAAEAPAEEAAADDGFSFDDDEDDDGAAAALIRKKAEDAEKKKKASEKERPPAKSTVILDVKPMEEDTDLVELEQLVRKITPEGLLWGACEKVPVAYGICNLRMLCTIVDDLVSVDDLETEIQALPGVQTTDIYSFNKV